MKSRKKIREAIEVARRIWLSRQDINDALLPSHYTPDQVFIEQVRMAQEDVELNRAFLIVDALSWVLELNEDEDNFVTDMLDRYNQQAPERTGESEYESL